MKILPKIFEFSHIGHRNENQDRYIVLYDQSGEECLIVVADGMGGHKGGSVAAQAVVDSVKESWDLKKDEDPDVFLKKLVLSAHYKVNSAGEAENLSPKSTLSVLYVYGHSAKSIHVGDSRIIQFNADGFVKRTVDHSVAQLQLLQGKITEDEMADHPDQNKLYTSIGGDDEPDFEIETWDVDDSKFVVCSDGFWELFTQDEMKSALDNIHSQRDLKRLTTKLIDDMKRHDNTTSVILDFRRKPVPNKSKTTWLSMLILGVCLAVLAVYLMVSSIDDTPTPNSPRSQEEMPSDKNTDSTNIEKPINGIPGEGGESQHNEPSTEGGTEGGAEGGTEGDREGEADVSDTITTKRRRVDVPVTGNDDAILKTKEWLKESGDIGGNDSLEKKGNVKSLGKSSVIKLQQSHKGIPVYGAETIIIVEDSKITDIDGRSVADINIDINPKMTYQDVIETASKELQQSFKPQDKGSLIIYKGSEGYILSWLGVVITEKNVENIIFNSNNGKILTRHSTVIDYK